MAKRVDDAGKPVTRYSKSIDCRQMRATVGVLLKKFLDKRSLARVLGVCALVACTRSLNQEAFLSVLSLGTSRLQWTNCLLAGLHLVGRDHCVLRRQILV